MLVTIQCPDKDNILKIVSLSKKKRKEKKKNQLNILEKCDLYFLWFDF